MSPQPRIRELADKAGHVLRISAEQYWNSAVVVLQRTDMSDRPLVVLDRYGAEMLTGYIMASRLALPDGLSPERVGGSFESVLSLDLEPAPAIRVEQTNGERGISVPAVFWDRLYAELCLIIPHVRAIAEKSRSQSNQFPLIH